MLDLGWLSLEHLTKKRTLMFKKKMLDSKDSLTMKLREINEICNLPWENRCKEFMKELGLELYNDRIIERTGLKDWKELIDRAASESNLRGAMRRLKEETYRTTEIYSWARRGTKQTYMSTYLMVNSDMHSAIGTIFRLRAGFNNCKGNAFIRHLTDNPACCECEITETEEHMFGNILDMVKWEKN
ncbi:unnamed protein product [Blepharisma stoltei]|uniref:Uncharacterized protein n=1 Tax=Blepharisma stoltei TaxID=1481888 RepID=A0AAU9JSH0_9CILI|nr:unnamed protein product [Blepharisma stoltei]